MHRRPLHRRPRMSPGLSRRHAPARLLHRNGMAPCRARPGSAVDPAARSSASARPGAMSVEISRAPFDREPNTHGTRSKVARNISTDLASDENSRGSANATVAADAPPPRQRGLVRVFNVPSWKRRARGAPAKSARQNCAACRRSSERPHMQTPRALFFLSFFLLRLAVSCRFAVSCRSFPILGSRGVVLGKQT